ncbi:MAG: zf-HC2 domain-containing protein [Longimicrobiales bacterium]
MTDTLYHPEDDRLEAFAAGEIDRSDAAVVESHLLGCARCRADVEEWRSLFGALADLPALAPAPDFGDRVMAAVEVPRPFAARIAALIERLTPRTRRAWALLVALLAPPAAGAAVLLAWIASLPWLTVEGLAGFAADQVAEGFATLPQHGLGLVSDTTVGVWLNDALQRVLAAGTAPIGVAAGLFAVMLLLSVWVLYQNLFRTPSRDHGYANFCF